MTNLAKNLALILLSSISGIVGILLVIQPSWFNLYTGVLILVATPNVSAMIAIMKEPHHG